MWFTGAWFCDGCGFLTGVYSECGLQERGGRGFVMGVVL